MTTEPSAPPAPPGARLESLAAAVADGVRVDWEAAEGACLDAEERRVVARLRSVSALVEVGRRLGEEGPRRWGPLVLLDPLGRGASGEVLSAWDTQLERPVAVKLLRRFAPDQPGPEASLDEARRLARVRHRSVVSVYGADTFDGESGLWMERLDGRTLAAAVGAAGPLHWREAVRVGINLCAALEAVHAAGLLHRDLTAANVVLEEDGRVVLTDFGIGCEARAAASARPRGTPLYVAPEVLAGGAPSVAADLYALGVLLFYALTAGFPVDAGSLEELRRAYAAGGARVLGEVRGDVPADLTRVVARALERKPSGRFASAAEMRLALARVQDVPYSEPEPGRRLARRRAMMLVGTGLAAVAVLWWSAVRAPRPTPAHDARVTPPAPRPPDLPQALVDLASVYEALGRCDEARPLYRRALTVVEARDGPGSEAAARIAARLAWCQRGSGAPAEARVPHARAPRDADPFVAPARRPRGLADLLRLSGVGTPYSIEARVVRDPSPGLAIEGSTALFVYLLEAPRVGAIDLHAWPARPHAAHARHVLCLPAAAGRLVVLACPMPVAELEGALAAAPASARAEGARRVRLSSETSAWLRTFSVSPEAVGVEGPCVFGGARPLGPTLEIVRGVWIRELRLPAPGERAPTRVD